MSSDDGRGPLDDIESGLDALVLVDIAREVLDAVDTEALQGDAPLDEAIDEGQLRQAIGGPAGRLVARQLADRATGGGVAGLIGREIAGRVGSAAVRRAIERADPEALAAAFEGADGYGPDPKVGSGGDPVEIDVEDGSDDES
jgi:hypothetical protein